MKISNILLTGAFLLSATTLSAQCPGGNCGNNGNTGNNKYYQQRSDNEQNSAQRNSNSMNRTEQNTEVTRKVRSALQNDSSLNLNDIQISTDSKGNVTLNGTVANSAEKSKIEALVKQVDGVNGVTNNLSTSK